MCIYGLRNLSNDSTTVLKLLTAPELGTAGRLAASYQAGLLQRAESPSLLLSAWLLVAPLLVPARQLPELQCVSRTVEPLHCSRPLLGASPVSFMAL